MFKHHEATMSAKETFVNTLSYVIDKLNKEKTLKSIAAAVGYSVSTVSNIKHGRSKFVSFEAALNIADKLKLTYSITLTSKNGVATYQVKCESGVSWTRRHSEKPVSAMTL